MFAAKLNSKMKKYYDKGSKVLPELAVGDKVRIQNQTMVRTTRWDKTGVIMRVLKDRQYEILVDGSMRLTVRNRRHLRKVEKPAEEAEVARA